MVDTNDIVRAWLLGVSSVTDLLGTNANESIYATPDLPEHFDPALGPVIQVFNAGGVPHGEIPPLVNDRKCLKVWGNFGKNKLVKSVFAACFDLMHGANMVTINGFGTITKCQFETMPQEITDPDTGWPFLQAYFNIEAFGFNPSLADFVDTTQTAKQYIDQQVTAEVAAINDVDGGTF